MRPELALISLERRFAAKTQITPTCHLWTSTLNNFRPAISVSAALIGKTRTMQGSHVAWFLHYGVWPVQLNHTSCHNGLCVRWDHLYEGTQVQNGADFAAQQTAICCRSGLHLRTVANTGTTRRGTRYCLDCKSLADAKRQVQGPTRNGKYKGRTHTV
jgi:hypothetical protein